MFSLSPFSSFCGSFSRTEKQTFMTWKCPECDVEVETPFCTTCGASQPDVAKCGRCMTAITGKFCGSCGLPYSEAIAAAPQEATVGEVVSQSPPPPPPLHDASAGGITVAAAAEVMTPEMRLAAVRHWKAMSILFQVLLWLAVGGFYWALRHMRESVFLWIFIKLLVIPVGLLYMFYLSRVVDSKSPMATALKPRGGSEFKLALYVGMSVLMLEWPTRALMGVDLERFAMAEPVDTEEEASATTAGSGKKGFQYDAVAQWYAHQFVLWFALLLIAFVIHHLYFFLGLMVTGLVPLVLVTFTCYLSFVTTNLSSSSPVMKDLYGKRGVAAIIFYILMVMLTLALPARLCLGLRSGAEAESTIEDEADLYDDPIPLVEVSQV